MRLNGSPTVGGSRCGTFGTHERIAAPCAPSRRRLTTHCKAAHVISFDMGVIELGLTPEFLDSEKNILTAHRRTCNKGCELDLIASMTRLRELGVKELPPYLPAATLDAWRTAAE